MAKLASVEAYISGHPRWEPILNSLQAMLLELGFAEAKKWQLPIHMLGGENLIGLGAFKNHFPLWFMEGHLLKNPPNVLSNAQPGKTMEMRHWKWFGLAEFDHEAVRAYSEEVKEMRDH